MNPEEKHLAIRPLLREDAIERVTATCYDCLPADLRERYDIVETTNISAHEYDGYALEIIRACQTGWVLDCGAGLRRDYHPNVVNYEVVDYRSTDVLGVAEHMPFEDGSFDGVICLNVLEHVKDPFRVASEISRVLKPGGKLYCVTPFLQPAHGYPHHYYNMTAQGLKNLFCGNLDIDRQMMLGSGLPIWTLSWFLNTWCAGLRGDVRARFLEMKVAELSADPVSQLGKPYVATLSEDKNFEIASTTALFATKPRTAPFTAQPAFQRLANEKSRLEHLMEHFFRIKQKHQRELDDERLEKQSLKEALVAARREQRSLEQALKDERLEEDVMDAQRKVARADFDELHLILNRKNQLIDELDRRLNLIRRSRMWRFRRRFLRFVRICDGKD